MSDNASWIMIAAGVAAIASLVSAFVKVLRSRNSTKVTVIRDGEKAIFEVPSEEGEEIRKIAERYQREAINRVGNIRAAG